MAFTHMEKLYIKIVTSLPDGRVRITGDETDLTLTLEQYEKLKAIQASTIWCRIHDEETVNFGESLCKLEALAVAPQKDLL